MLRIRKRVWPLHFEDWDGREFERLVFAYHVRTEPAYSFEWVGKAGRDKGRDIVGRGQTAETKGHTILVACANWQKFTTAKAISDVKTCLSSPLGKPDFVRFVTGSNTIGSKVRDDVRSYCDKAGIYRSELWSSSEFEEHLRATTESLLRRFLEGESFPDGIAELIHFSRSIPPENDAEAIALLSKIFDRPAFQDTVSRESSLPAFRQAIGDTIGAINTGVWRTREGDLIAILPSKDVFQRPAVRDVLEETVVALRSLRTHFDDALRSGQIKPCGCNQPECPIFSMDQTAADQLQQARQKALDLFARATHLATA